MLNTSKLFRFLSNKYETENLKFNILRVFLDEYECEISLPRLEVFTDEFSHSNFKAEFISDLDYSQGVMRRDFTLNAIYLEYNEGFSLIDPLGGVKDLLNNNLVPCSQSFNKDPVRYLRLVRFMLRDNLEVEDQLLQEAKSIPIISFSSHYLKNEAIKSGKPLLFFSEFITIPEVGIGSWDSNFNGEIGPHIGLCPFLNSDDKTSLLNLIKISTKHSYSFPHSASIKKLFENDFKELVSILVRLEKSSLDQLNTRTLVDMTFNDFTFEDFIKFKDKTYRLSEEDLKQGNREYNKIILRNRLGFK
jgi:hypothetical protein